VSEAQPSGQRRPDAAGRRHRAEPDAPRRRLFVALDLPADVREALPRPAAPWRPVPVQNLHVTLAFLGDVDPQDAAAAVPTSFAAGPLRTAAAILLPPRRPRVLAVELEDLTGACTRLQAAVAAALVEAGVYEPESRPWLPHVTIGRTRERVRRDAALPPVSALEFLPEAVTLYDSRGGRYEPLARHELGTTS
jgi:2'-5' RNA ligase